MTGTETDQRSALTADIVRKDSLSSAAIREMYEVFAASYVEVSEEIFRADLSGKSHVIVLRDAGGILRGFSTIAIWELDEGRLKARFLFSGDTVIDPAYWGDRALPVAWMEALGATHALDPATPAYWLLISMSARTFKSLPMTFYDFHPREGSSVPEGLADAVGRTFFADRFDPVRGIIRGGPMTGRLKQNLAKAREKELRLPDVQEFVRRNPDFERGDELVCLAPLVADNIRPWLRRCFVRGAANKQILD
jgi:hypothetical protein